MKKIILFLPFLALLFNHRTVPEASVQDQLPSVADVFGNKSANDIASDIQATQQFVDELHANGSPEDIAEFYKMLEQTMAQMTDKDWEDIMGITNMVAPIIGPDMAMPGAQQPQTLDTPPLAIPTSITTHPSNDFKDLINKIIERIDEIFQKIASSKVCSEYTDTVWKNRSTFFYMKRLIAQLRVDRLAAKFNDDDASTDIKNLKSELKEFSNSLNTYNESIKIKDSFGLIDNTADKNNLKIVKEFLNYCDDIIDSLLPKFEKFFQKFDSEALLIAKEAESKEKKATTDALIEAKRSSSTPSKAGSKSASNRQNYNPYSDYDSSGGYNSYPDYDSNYNSNFEQPDSSETMKKTGDTSSEKSEIAPKATDKTSDNTKKDKENSSADIFDKVFDDLQDHLETIYNKKHEDSFIDYVKNDLVNDYPNFSAVGLLGKGEDRGTPTPPVDPTAPPSNAPVASGASGQPPSSAEEAWVEGANQFTVIGFKPYTEKALATLKSDYTSEINGAGDLVDKIRNNLYQMSTEELNKIQSSNLLNDLERRFNNYQKAFEDAIPKLNKKMNNNAPDAAAPELLLPGKTQSIMQSVFAKKEYQENHKQFISELAKIKKTISSVQDNITLLKRRAKNTAEKSKNKNQKQASA